MFKSIAPSAFTPRRPVPLYPRRGALVKRFGTVLYGRAPIAAEKSGGGKTASKRREKSAVPVRKTGMGTAGKEWIQLLSERTQRTVRRFCPSRVQVNSERAYPLSVISMTPAGRISSILSTR